MSFARLERLLASTSFRLAATYACLVIVSFLLAGAGVWIATRQAAIVDLRRHVRAESDYLVGIAEQRGLDAAAKAIRAHQGRPGTLIYRLDAPGGALIAGDASIPNGAANWATIDLPNASSGVWRGDHLVYTRVLRNGARLTVADDLERAERIRNAVLQALTWVGSACVLLALNAGIWATRRTLARMDALSRTAREVGAGDLSLRAPSRSTPTPDDIDQLTGGFNDMLDRIDLLVGDIRRVSANVAHDLRTPLTHLRQKLETAIDATGDGSRRQILEAAQADIDDVLRKFDAMLRLAEIDAGAMRAHFTPVDLFTVTERVADAYRPDIESGRRSLETHLARDVSVTGDANLLAQAVANLLENAMRHTPRGATISLELANVAGHARLVIRDDGAGIRDCDRARLLKPFERGDVSRGEPGAGLGLSISAAIARLHGAVMNLENASPGLRVAIVFPARQV